MRDDVRPHGTSDDIGRAFKTTQNEERFDVSDLPHDSYLEPRSDSLKNLAESIFQEVEALRPPSSRKPRADAVERRRQVVSNLIANLMRLTEAKLEDGSIIVSLKKEASTRYDRELHKDLISTAIRGLTELGWIDAVEAEFKKRRTTIRATLKLKEAFAESGDGPHIGRASGGETIVLSAYIRRRTPKKLVDYQDTQETIALRAQMDFLNAQLEAADLRYAGRAIYAGHLTRRFQIEGLDAPHSFELMGRVYGAFWMNLAKSNRHLITIDGEQLIDADFVSMFSSLAYIEAGHSVPRGDAYEGIDGLTRQESKTALLTLLSRRGGAMRRLPGVLSKQLGTRGWTGAKLEAAIRARHPDIKHLFSKGIGLRLMKTESDVLLHALMSLAENNILGLAMHDGIMSKGSAKLQTITAMRAASKAVLGVELEVAEKPIEKPHEI